MVFLSRGGGDSGFQVTGMVEGFLGGLKFSIPGSFWVQKFGKYFFGWLDLSRDIFSSEIKAGVHLKAVLTSLNTAFLPISRSRFKRRQISLLIPLTTVWRL